MAIGSGGRFGASLYSRPAKAKRLPSIRFAKGTSGKQASRDGLREAMSEACAGRNSETECPSGASQLREAMLPPSSGTSSRAKPPADKDTRSDWNNDIPPVAH